MDINKIERILSETAYVRTGGSDEELRCAEYIQELCAEIGLEAEQELFEVDMADMKEASLIVDGREVPCKGYLNAGSGEVEAPFYYLTNTDPHSLSQCRGKIVMVDGHMRYWMYQDLLANGAAGFITYDGNANYADRDIDQRELRTFVHMGNKILGVSINAKDAIQLVQNDASTAKIMLKQREYASESQNVVVELPGETEELIVFTAHYDSTSLSQGAYDNMSGSIGLLALAEHFATAPHRYSLRFIWCGSEERGLVGSKAYCELHDEEMKDIALCINLDMIGCAMGKFIACCTSEEKLVHYIQYFADEQGFGIAAKDGVYSSDSTPFADRLVPAVSFARIAPTNTATIHNSYDTAAIIKPAQLLKDVEFIAAFADRMVNAQRCPVSREMPEKMKEKLDYYLCRKRDPEDR